MYGDSGESWATVLNGTFNTVLAALRSHSVDIDDGQFIKCMKNVVMPE